MHDPIIYVVGWFDALTLVAIPAASTAGEVKH
jgi:hypothetical protein